MACCFQQSLINNILIIDLVLFFKAEVYKAVAKPLIENVITGYNATVFAYGATGMVQFIKYFRWYVCSHWSICVFR